MDENKNKMPEGHISPSSGCPEQPPVSGKEAAGRELPDWNHEGTEAAGQMNPPEAAAMAGESAGQMNVPEAAAMGGEPTGQMNPPEAAAMGGELAGQMNPPEAAAMGGEPAGQNAAESRSYTYQNPHPYQNMNPYGYPVAKKKGNKTAVIVAAVAAGVMLICCLLIIASFFVGNLETLLPETDSGGDSSTGEIIGGGSSESQSGAQRDEETVYNMPEITKEEKTGEELTLVEINKKVQNSVVGILISEDGRMEASFSGSGFIISQDGYIITNDHVVGGAAQVVVVLSDGITEYDAVIVGEDDRSDLAILKIDAEGLSPVELGDSDDLEVGETVAAIGNPYGMELAGTLTNGIISALNRKIEMNGTFMTLIQTNASINPGNSGGPLVNAYGQVVGITSSKLVATEYEGIGFAIPINYVVEVAEELINYGYVKTRAYIGIQGQDLTETYAAYHNLPQGVYVSYVDPECDAAAKGLQEGDVIIGFNGEEISSMAELNDLKDSFHPGDVVTIKIWRNGEELDITINLTEATG